MVLRCFGETLVVEIMTLSRDLFIFSSFTKMIRSDSFTDSFSDHFFILHKIRQQVAKKSVFMCCLKATNVFTCYKN